MGLLKKDRDKAVAKRRRGVELAISYGANLENANIWFSKYLLLKNNAKKRKTPMLLSFKQYLLLAKKAELRKPQQIGNKPGKYQLGRLGDTGPYAMGNCRFITHEQNREEQYENGGNAKAGISRAGQNKYNRPLIMEMSIRMTGRTKEDYEYLALGAEKRSRKFVVKSPDGRVFKGKNLKEFCDSHGISQGSMSLVCNGHRLHHRKWTGKYLD